MLFKLKIDAWKMEKTSNAYYGVTDEKKVNIEASDLYEAITKYLQVKGYTAKCVDVSKEKEDVSN